MAEYLNTELSRILSSIIRVKADDGSFVPVFPINTANEVYVDIDKQIKLSTELSRHMRIVEVDDINAMYSLTEEKVRLMDLVKVADGPKYFLVIDIANLNSSAGYLEMLTSKNIGVPGGIPQLDEEGKIPAEVSEPVIEFIIYTNSDIIP